MEANAAGFRIGSILQVSLRSLSDQGGCGLVAQIADVKILSRGGAQGRVTQNVDKYHRKLNLGVSSPVFRNVSRVIHRV